MTTKQTDNWGWRARFGLFIVSNEAVPEAEWWAMAPPDVSVHAARVTASTPWARWDDGRSAVTLEDDLARGAVQFSAMRLSAVVIGHSSSSIVGGAGWDDAVVGSLSDHLPDVPVITTNGRDCQAALRASGVSQPFLVIPPWFGDAFVPEAEGYFSDSGFSPAGSLRVDPGPGWRELPPSELYPRGMGFEQDVESLYRQICSACPVSADGVLLAGTGLRCVGIIDALEKDLGRPVITANQASLWHCLRLSGVRTPVTGYGSLLAL